MKVIKDKLERCGFCGSYFRGVTIIPQEGVEKLTEKELKEAPLGYCPNAYYEAEDDEQRHYVTKDMATDAGMPEMEGQPF